MRRTGLVPAGLALVATAPAARWWWRRLGDGSDDPLAPLALVALLAILGGELRAAAPPRAADLRLPAACLLAYAATVSLAPPLAGAALALLALTSTLAALAGRRLGAPRLGLVALALPVVASAQYFLGYPLRRLATLLAARLVAPLGLLVRPAGVTLQLPDATLVVVDAPCAGIRTLWMAAFLALLIAERRRAGAAGTARLLLLAVGGAVAANGLRASALVALELAPAPIPGWLHEGVGLTCFAALAAGLVLAGPSLAGAPRPGAPPPEATPEATPDAPAGAAPTPRGHAAFVAAAALAALAPWLPAPATPAAPGFPGFPTHLEGHPLEPLDLDAAEARAARSLPGRVGRFRWRGGEVVLTWIHRPTRALHPARDCYRGLGLRAEGLPPTRDGVGRPLGRLRVHRPDQPGAGFLVHEQVVDAAGAGYEDVGRWIWAALLGASPGPWWAVRHVGPGPPPTLPEGMLEARP